MTPKHNDRPLTGLTRGIRMIEKMYEENLKENAAEVATMDFPELVRFCRELMGLKQYACAEYLGFEEPRYKKIESGKFSEPIEAWELARLDTFFKLGNGVLQIKQKQFLTQGPKARMEKGKEIWNSDQSTTGVRASRNEPNYKRVRGTLDGEKA